MAVKTASNLKRENMGSKNLLVATFTDLDDGDTYASGLGAGGVFAHWFQRTDNPTTTAAVGVSVAESSGTFTFYPAEDDATGNLFIMTNK